MISVKPVAIRRLPSSELERAGMNEATLRNFTINFGPQHHAHLIAYKRFRAGCRTRQRCAAPAELPLARGCDRALAGRPNNQQ